MDLASHRTWGIVRIGVGQFDALMQIGNWFFGSAAKFSGPTLIAATGLAMFAQWALLFQSCKTALRPRELFRLLSPFENCDEIFIFPLKTQETAKINKFEK